MIRLPPDFREFLRLLNSHRVEYLLIGTEEDFFLVDFSFMLKSLPFRPHVLILFTLCKEIPHQAVLPAPVLSMVWTMMVPNFILSMKTTLA